MVKKICSKKNKIKNVLGSSRSVLYIPIRYNRGKKKKTSYEATAQEILIWIYIELNSQNYGND